MKKCGYSGCNEPAETTTWYNVEVCNNHIMILHNELRVYYLSSKIYDMYNNGELIKHSIGYTYIILLPNGNIKIGFSRDKDRLHNRFLSLERKFNGRIKLLAVIEGGETMEAVLHTQFSHLRIPSLGDEQFINSSEILLFVENYNNENDITIFAEAHARLLLSTKFPDHVDISNRNNLEPVKGKKHLPPDELEKRRENVRKVACPECGSPVGQKCLTEDKLPREANHYKRAKEYSKNRHMFR